MKSSLAYTSNSELHHQLSRELTQLMDWWATHMPDQEQGGFYGRISNGHTLHPQADKGIILNTRILWTFAAAARHTKREVYHQMADRAWQYILDHFYDRDQGGVFWMVDANGHMIDGKKQIYAQAFAIYAFTEYHLLTSNPKALQLAKTFFLDIENYSRDKQYGGYLEAFDRFWKPIEDLRLSDKDANEAKTMNTHLHILEAYTHLFRVYQGQDLREALRSLILLFIEKFIDPSTSHLHLFFDEEWQLKSSEISFGHDIECSWLLYEAAEVLGEKDIIAKVKDISLKMAQATLSRGIDPDGSVSYERSGNHYNKEKHWWPQAEAVVGFWNAWQLSQKESYRNAAIKCWAYIQENIKDPIHGEWHWGLNEDGTIMQEDKAGPWKAPYHNGRMCLEIIHRYQ